MYRLHIVNGVEKRQIGDELTYMFDKATISANVATESIRFKYKETGLADDSIFFSDIEEKFGTSTVEEYCDYLANNSFFFEVGEGGEDVPQFENEAERDTEITAPEDGDKCYLLNHNLQQIYRDDFGLWLDANKAIAIRQANMPTGRIVYVNGSFPPSGFEYPFVTYPLNGRQGRGALGVVMRIGKQIDLSRSYVSIQVSGTAYIDFGESIAAGEYIRAKINGSNADQGFAEGTGNPSNTSIGIAVQNSGANPSEPARVLTKLGMLS